MDRPYDVVIVGGGGRTVLARRVVVATGLTDELPTITGLAQRWGRDVVSCPYCHGWEVRDRLLGVLGTGPRSVHQALMLRQWSTDVTFFPHTLGEPDEQSSHGSQRRPRRGRHRAGTPSAARAGATLRPAAATWPHLSPRRLTGSERFSMSGACDRQRVPTCDVHFAQLSRICEPPPRTPCRRSDVRRGRSRAVRGGPAPRRTRPPRSGRPVGARSMSGTPSCPTCAGALPQTTAAR